MDLMNALVLSDMNLAPMEELASNFGQFKSISLMNAFRDVDECAHDQCPHGCQNNVGSFDCICREGFAKMDGICVDIDECQEMKVIH